MQATTDELAVMLQVQHTDLELSKTKKQFDKLPQRDLILQAREKKRAVQQKRDQVEQLRAKAEAAAAKYEDEDASLAGKQREVQAAIDGAKGDYRNVEARTKELNGIAKRRAAIEEELGRLGDELERIEGVRRQVADALAEVERRESAAVLSFQKEGGELQSALARLKAERAVLAERLPAVLREAYDRVAARGNGVAVGLLKEGRCGVCRMPIEEGRLIEIKAQAPLATCPHCKRLLIVASE